MTKNASEAEFDGSEYEDWDYPTAKHRGIYAEVDALSRWPLARDVYELLAEIGPSTASVLAERIGQPVARIENVLWWLTFADDNGCRQFVCGHLLTYHGSAWARVRLVHMAPAPPAGADLTAWDRAWTGQPCTDPLAEARATAWFAALDLLTEPKS